MLHAWPVLRRAAPVPSTRMRVLPLLAPDLSKEGSPAAGTAAAFCCTARCPGQWGQGSCSSHRAEHGSNQKGNRQRGTDRSRTSAGGESPSLPHLGGGRGVWRHNSPACLPLGAAGAPGGRCRGQEWGATSLRTDGGHRWQAHCGSHDVPAMLWCWAGPVVAAGVVGRALCNSARAATVCCPTPWGDSGGLQGCAEHSKTIGVGPECCSAVHEQANPRSCSGDEPTFFPVCAGWRGGILNFRAPWQLCMLQDSSRRRECQQHETDRLCAPAAAPGQRLSRAGPVQHPCQVLRVPGGGGEWGACSVAAGGGGSAATQAVVPPPPLCARLPPTAAQ